MLFWLENTYMCVLPLNKEYKLQSEFRQTKVWASGKTTKQIASLFIVQRQTAVSNFHQCIKVYSWKKDNSLELPIYMLRHTLKDSYCQTHVFMHSLTKIIRKWRQTVLANLCEKIKIIHALFDRFTIFSWNIQQTKLEYISYQTADRWQASSKPDFSFMAKFQFYLFT